MKGHAWVSQSASKGDGGSSPAKHAGVGWLGSADRALGLAVDQIKLIRAVTPRNAAPEIALLERDFRRGARRLPRWEYDPLPVSGELCLALDRLAQFLEGLSPLGQLYAARARELCLEASIIHAVGTPKLRALARQRFVGVSQEDREDRDQADELASAWTDSPANEDAWQAHMAARPDGDLVRSCDDNNPASLFSAMSREAGRFKLPVRVLVQPGLASLAATADGAILVTADKWLGCRDVERTVLHEIAGHALPRAKASMQPFGIFLLGTARGVDDQEGRALLIEEAAGFLDHSRRRELGLRHLAAGATLDGANAVDIIELLLARGASIETAVRIMARVQRGGSGFGGLAREIVYLPAFVRVGRAMRGQLRAPTETMMSGGRVAANVAPLLSTLICDQKRDDVVDWRATPIGTLSPRPRYT
jgi:hypothetical protein